jgi:hypothetical protein
MAVVVIRSAQCADRTRESNRVFEAGNRTTNKKAGLRRPTKPF